MASRVKVWSFSATGEDGKRYEVIVYVESLDPTALPAHTYELEDGTSVIRLPEGGFQIESTGVHLKVASES